MYKRVAGIEDEGELLDLQEEFIDRFGDIPKPVNNLLYIALIKAKAHAVYLTSVEQKGEIICLVPYAKAKYKVEKIGEFVEQHSQDLKFHKGSTPYFEYRLPKEQIAVKGQKKAGGRAAANKSSQLEKLKILLEDFKNIL